MILIKSWYLGRELIHISILKKIQIHDIEIIIFTYGLSGSFGSRVWFKCIGLNTYTYISSNFSLKPTPIHGPVHKYYLNYSYSRSHFSKLPQIVAKNLIWSGY